MRVTLNQFIAIGSALTLLFTVFSPITLLCMALLLYSAWVWLRGLMLLLLQRGLISYFSPAIESTLLNMSPADIFRYLWASQPIHLMRIAIGLLSTNQSEGMECLEGELKSKMERKGFVASVIPDNLLKYMIGEEKMNEFRSNVGAKRMMQIDEESSTDVQQKVKSKKIQPNKRSSAVLNRKQFIEPSSQSEDKLQVGEVNSPAKNKSVILPSPSPKQTIPQLFRSSLSMLRSFVHLHSLPSTISAVSYKRMACYMAAFWIIVGLQCMLNQRARKVVVRTMLIMGGIASVGGAVGSTSLMAFKLYREWQEKAIKKSKEIREIREIREIKQDKQDLQEIESSHMSY